MNENQIFDVLTRIQLDLNLIKKLESVPCNSALYGFLCSASFSVDLSIQHLSELDSENYATD